MDRDKLFWNSLRNIILITFIAGVAVGVISMLIINWLF